jgi:hypothetical protein
VVTEEFVGVIKNSMQVTIAFYRCYLCVSAGLCVSKGLFTAVSPTNTSRGETQNRGCHPLDNHDRGEESDSRRAFVPPGGATCRPASLLSTVAY